MKCSHHECNDEATHNPKIMVPAIGYAIDAHQPLGCTIGVNLCLKHCKEFDVKGTLNIEQPNHNGVTLKKVFNILARGRVPPDFNRAYIHPVSVTCEEAKVLAENTKTRRDFDIPNETT